MEHQGTVRMQKEDAFLLCHSFNVVVRVEVGVVMTIVIRNREHSICMYRINYRDFVWWHIRQRQCCQIVRILAGAKS
eukprot:1310324-Karenia_brevis.AAC.1